MQITKKRSPSLDPSEFDKLTDGDGTSYFSVIPEKTILRKLRVFCNTFMKKNAGQPCISPGNRVSKSKWTGPVIRRRSLIPTLVTPDFPYIHKELLKSGVTLKLLWQEYVDTCRNTGRPPYGYSQYCKLYQDYAAQNKLTMHFQHKPGDKLMVDWAGIALPLYDKTTGNSNKVYLFAATLPFSMYCYAQACRTMKEEDWIDAHIAMYEFFGGVTRILTPDNLKAGILSNRKYEDPVINRAYQELADYYQTALLPARVLAPRDKAAVEGSVGNLTSHIIARLRNRKFFDIHTMNTAICKEPDRFNDTPFQKKDGSRHSVFLEEERPFLQPLPKCGFFVVNF